MRAYVDPDVCIGCGMCTGIEPSVFQMNDDGKAEAVEDTTEATKATVKEAVESCPVTAISEDK